MHFDRFSTDILLYHHVPSVLAIRSYVYSNAWNPASYALQKLKGSVTSSSKLEIS